MLIFWIVANRIRLIVIIVVLITVTLRIIVVILTGVFRDIITAICFARYRSSSRILVRSFRWNVTLCRILLAIGLGCCRRCGGGVIYVASIVVDRRWGVYISRLIITWAWAGIWVWIAVWFWRGVAFTSTARWFVLRVTFVIFFLKQEIIQ